MILACNQITKSFISDVILDGVTFHIEEREKIALIGMNGSGKTTLFRIICGELAADSGEIIKSKNCSIGYLPQHVSINSDKTVYDELLSVFNHIIQMEKDLNLLESKISTASGESLNSLMKEYDLLRHTFEENNGYSYQSLIRGVLKGLGLSNDTYEQPISILSGGQKTRVALAKLLLQNPSVLLLDEPTNHLDIEAIEWLESFLKGYNGSVILISHDRYFLDRIVTKIVEIEHHKAKVYHGNYSHFTVQKELDYEIELKHYNNQQQEIKKQEEVIDKLRQFNREKSVKRAMSREKQLAKVERLDKPLGLSSGMKLTLTPRIQSGNDVVIADSISKSFGSNPLFQNLSFQVKRGDKIALVGPNGVGKTTLFRIIMNTLEATHGSISYGSNVNIGYYDQEHQNLDASNTIIEEMQSAFPTLTNGAIRNVLAAFLFTGDDVFKSISTLSGGEKGRVALSKIMLSEANLLLLDEPTNHLDIQSKEILESALSHYEGTVLYISHDRYFINQTATKVLELLPSGIETYMGNYDYYLEKKAEASISPVVTTPDETSTKADWLKSKEAQAQRKRLERELSSIEDEIQETEASIAFIDEQLCLEEVYTNSELSLKYITEKSDLDAKLEILFTKWEDATSALDRD